MRAVAEHRPPLTAGRLGRLQLLRLPFPLALGLRLDLICTPAGLPIIWALAAPKLDEREVLTAIQGLEGNDDRAGQVEAVVFGGGD